MLANISNSIIQLLSGPIAAIGAFFRYLITPVKNIIDMLWSGLKEIASFFSRIINWVVGAVKSVAGIIED